MNVNSEPYFVPSSASASEILTNVAIQDLFAVEDAEFYGVVPGRPARTPMLGSVEDSWDDAFDFSDEDGDPFACDWDEDSDESESDSTTSSSSLSLSLSSGAVDSDESPPSWSPPRSGSSVSGSGSGSTTGSARFPALGPASTLPSSVRINDRLRVFASSVVEVTFRNTGHSPPSPEEDDSDSDDEQTIVIPVLRFRDSNPHRLPTIIEDDEEEGDSDEDEDEDDDDDASDTETIRPSTYWPSSAAYQSEYGELPREPSLDVQTDRRMSI